MIKILLIGCLSIFNSCLYAQAWGEGAAVATVGYGFPNLYKSIYKSLISSSATNNAYYGVVSYDVRGVGPAFAKADYGITKLIGLGLSVGYMNTIVTATEHYNGTEYNSSTGNYETKAYEDITKYTYSSFSIGARLNFHFGTGQKLDPYAGISAGYSANNYSLTYYTNNPNGSTPLPEYGSGIPVYLGFTAGLRYYFIPNFGIYGEVGIEKWSVIQGGIAIKLRHSK